MKQIMNGGGGGGGLRIPTAAEAQVAEILINMRELIKRRSFTWGMKKKRSVLVSKSESETRRRVGGGSPEKVAAAVVAAEADKSPTTPLCFLPPVKKNVKRKAADDLVESYNRMQQEKEILLRETKAMRTLHQGLTFKNMELKAIIQKVKFTRNIEDFHQWNNSRKIIDQQSYYPQISMFAPPTQQRQQHCQQLMVDPSNWCSVNSHSGGRFGLFNQVDPRVKIHDFMGCFQPLDQSKYMMVDNHLTVRSAAAAARQRRILRMKENKRVSRGCR
ncbi:uncharacterized protein LOC143605855 [Bidens hawaiensis]|uniref:uncharacterized protein LOC143605855 n=1 Tax=Bidens hawaiensis TaxID=980011 RepID=UPI004049B15A